MLAIQDLEISLGKRKKLQSGSFEIKEGLWALIGRNGSGKSSFLNTILQVKQMTKGHIKLENRDISDWSVSEISKKISVVYTKPSIFGNYTVFEVVMLGRLPYTNSFGSASETDVSITREAIKLLHINHLEGQLFSVLSDGEKQMVMIARAIAQTTPIIILDEPTAFLDIVNRQKIVTLLKDIVRKENKIIVFSTHDVDLLPQLCDGLMWIHNGKLNASRSKSHFSNTINQLFLNEV